MLRSEFQYTAAIKWKPNGRYNFNSRRKFKHIQSLLERIYIQTRQERVRVITGSHLERLF